MTNSSGRSGRSGRKEPGEELFDALANFFCKLVSVNIKVLLAGFGRIYWVNGVFALFGFFVFSMIMAKNHYHLRFLQWLNADIFSYELMVKIARWGWWNNTVTLTVLMALGSLWILGLFQLIRLSPYQRALDAVSLKNGMGDKAKAVDVRRNRNGQRVVKVACYGIGIERFRKAKGDLEAGFDEFIDKIHHCGGAKYVEIVLGTKELPRIASFDESANELVKDGQFLIGESRSGVLSERIDKLPTC